MASPRPIAGCTGFVLGALALMLVLVQFWAGPFSPQQRAGVSIGEIAAEMRQAAIRKQQGLPQPPPAPAPWNSDRLLKVIAASLAGLAVILGGAALVRRETWRPAVGGIALGGGAIALHVFIWGILIVIGASVLCVIIQNVTGIIGE